jgi:hypothetical protein
LATDSVTQERDRLYDKYLEGEMRRREFMAGLGGVAAAWPTAGTTQEAARPLVDIAIFAPLQATISNREAP